MIIGIGIDSVEIHRFAHWQNYSKNRLQRIFSDEEIVYCLSNSLKSAERFAARFAAKEAFYKAISPLHPQEPFLKVAKYIEVNHEDGRPVLHANRERFYSVHPTICHISLTHTKTTTTAVVIIEKI